MGPQGLGREGRKGQRGEQVSQRLKFPLNAGQFVLVRTEIGHGEICSLKETNGEGFLNC